MNEQSIVAYWTPRRLMLLALVLHLISLPLPYYTGLENEYYLSVTETKTERTYTRTQLGSDYPAKNGVEVAPQSLVILPLLLVAFLFLQPKHGFWYRRRGYVLAFVLLLFCNGSTETFGGRMALFALAVGALATYRRYVTPEPAVATVAARD